MLVVDWDAEPVEECVIVPVSIAVVPDRVVYEPADSREGIILCGHSSQISKGFKGGDKPVRTVSV